MMVIAPTVASIALLWAISLCLPVWRTDRGTTNGRDVLFMGCFGLLVGQFQWLGNPLMAAVWLLALLGKFDVLLMVPLALGLVAVFAAAALKRSVMTDEGGHMSAIEHRYGGYYLWMAAVLISAALALYLGFTAGL
jgi:hypothetical protein